MRVLPYRLLATAAFLWIAAAASADDGWLLRRTYRSGESEKFNTTMKIESGAGEGGFKISADVAVKGSETVKEAKPDGGAVIDLKVDKATFSVLGQERNLAGEGLSTTFTVDKNGQVVRDARTGAARRGPNPAEMLALTRTFALPDKRLKAGDEHKFDAKSEENGKITRSVKGVMTVVGLEKKSDELPVEAVKVKFMIDAVVPAPADGVPEQNIHLEGHQWVDPVSGRIVLATGKVTGLKDPNIGQVTLEFRQSRSLVDDAKADTGK